jgi:hypothetical protein
VITLHRHPSKVTGATFWLGAGRRGLWLLVHLVVVTLAVFAVVGRSSKDRAVPLFINTNPILLGTHAWQLAETVGRGEAGSEAAASELLELGGAALPHLLPKLDSLEPTSRSAVLRALAPLAVRMQQVAAEPLDEAELEALWLTFWNDHSVDFHPAMARRVVRRFVQGPTPQRAQEVKRLDTFALSELLRELARLTRERAELEAVQPLLTLLCSVVTSPGAPCPTPALETRAQLRPTMEQWRAWWLRNHYRYETPNGVERVFAPLLQTEYAPWVRTSTRALLTGRAFAAWSWRPFLITLAQFSLITGVAWLTAAAALRMRFDKRARRGVVALAICLSFPVLVWFGGATLDGSLGCVLIALWGGTSAGFWAVLYQRVMTPRWPSGLGLYVHSSWLLGFVLVAEHLCHVHGLGFTLIGALKERELQTTVWTALCCALLGGLGHAVTSQLAKRGVLTGVSP